MKKVLVIRSQEESREESEMMRDFVLRSVGLGCLVLGQGMDLDMMELPEMGEAREPTIRAEEEAGAGETGLLLQGSMDGLVVNPCGAVVAAVEPDTKEPDGIKGPGAKEKKRIYEKLMEFRRKNGLGCMKKLIEVTGGQLKEGVLQAAVMGEKAPLQSWYLIERAIEMAEEKERKS